MIEAITVAHVADLHLGTGTVHGGQTDAGVPERLIDFGRVWKEACNQMAGMRKAGRLHAVLFAGDMARTRKPTPTENCLFLAGLQILQEVGLPVVMIPGNHDLSNTPGENSALDPFHTAHFRPQFCGPGEVYVIRKPEVVEVATSEDGPFIRVAGIPYFTRSWVAARCSTPLEEATARAEEAVGNIVLGLAADGAPNHAPDVLMVHHAIRGSSTSTGWETATGADPNIPVDVLRSGPWSYVAAGHIHKLQNLGDPHGPPIVYPGTLERVDFGEEHEPKGWCLATFEPGKPARWAHVPSFARPFRTCHVHLEARTAEEVEDYLIAHVRDVAGLDKGRDLPPVLRVRYSVRAEHAPLISTARILREARDAGAFHVSTIEPTLVGETRSTKIEGLTEEIRPEAALEKWLEASEELRPHSDALLEGFRELYQEVIHGR